MAPLPKKAAVASKVDLHTSHVPLSAPLNFVGPRTICYAVGNSVCVWDLDAKSKSYLPTTVYGITKLCTNVEKRLVAFCEGGASPQVYVYSLKPQKLLFTLSGVAELEVADLAFSRCGSRLYALARATSKKLRIFSMVTGEALNGCDIDLPLRFDKLSVYPGHKDYLAVVRGSSVRIVSITKSFETYITKLQPAAVPVDANLSISAYCWTATGHFLVATRQGQLITLDGSTGALVHVCQAERPITSISMTRSHLVTAHIGNTLNFWRVTPEAYNSVNPDIINNFFSGAGEPPPMAAASSGGVFKLKKTVDLESVGQSQRLGHRMLGQVACVQVAPNFSDAVLTTAEGEVWAMQLPDKLNQDAMAAMVEGAAEDEFEEDMYMRGDQLQMDLLAWFHTHPITCICNVGDSGLEVCASADEGGRFRIWEAVHCEDPKGFRLLRFASGITSIGTCVGITKLILLGTDSGCIHVINCEHWSKSKVVDTVRVSDVGIAKLCCALAEDGMSLKVAALLFNNKIGFASISLREPKVKMMGFVDLLGSIEDVCFHDKEEMPADPCKLLAVGTVSDVPAVWAVRSPKEGYEPKVAELDKEACPIWCGKLCAEKKLEEKPTSVCSFSRMNIAVGFAGGAVKIYPTPSLVGLNVAKQAVVSPVYSVAETGSQQLVTSLWRSQTNGILTVGSMDGDVRLHSANDTKAELVMAKTVHSAYTGGTLQVISSKDGKAVMSTGGSDGLLIWSAPDSGITLPMAPGTAAPPAEEEDELQGDFAFELDDTDLNTYPVWVPGTDLAAGADEEEIELSEEALKEKKLMMGEVDSLRKKLRVLVDNNNVAPDLEKLDRNEFCVDFEERDAIAAKSKERCDALRAEIDKKNTARQLIRDRLIKEFWDPMRGKGCMITSLMSSMTVPNYPERIVSEEESTTTRKLRQLRKSEQLELQMLRSGGGDCPPELRDDLVLEEDSFTTGREQFIVNWWPAKGSKACEARAQQLAEQQAEKDRIAAEKKAAAEKEAEKQKEKDAKAAKEGKTVEGKDEGAAAKAAEADGGRGTTTVDSFNTMEQEFLYAPFELVTNSRRRLQICLLLSLSAEYREHFNGLFKTCQSDKKNIIDGIKEKCARIKQIYGELQIEEDVPEPELQESEEAEAVLKVKDKEITVEKWISPEELKIMAEAAAKEEERLRQLRENDAGQRALVQMMGGTLKTKKDLSALEITLDKEAWMDEIPEEEMTDVQKAAYAEFQAKEKALAEAQDAYRKQLAAELKSLRSGVQDLTLQFEGLLKKLHHERFAHDAKFFCQELYCARLQLSLLQSVEDSLVRDQAQFELEAAQAKVKEAEERHAAFNEAVQNAKGVQDDRTRTEKEFSSAQHFRQAFANSTLEPNAITALLQLFRKKRESAWKAPERKSVAARSSLTGAQTASSLRQSVSGGLPTSAPAYNPFDAAAAGDPYPDLGAPEPKALAPDAPADDDPKFEDVPEGTVDEESFKKMMDLRTEKLKAEAEVQKGAAVINEMTGLLDHYKQEWTDAIAEKDRLERELREHKDLMNRELYDIELLFKLKQGQVEVPQAAVVTDYSDAIVIDQQVVESRNGRIMDLGKEKVSKLNTIKEFRKKLSLLEWEHTMLDLQTCDLEERTKDVHMLRVTKDLQSLLKGGEEGRNKAESDLLERKIEHLNETTEKKEQALKKQYAVGNHAAKLRKGENLMLEKKLRELQQNVIQREHIRRLRAPAGGGGGGGQPQKTGGGGRVEENEGAAKAAQQAFREVRNRQKLMEAAKKHTEEIEMLHKELDRLRQRTFPSFVQLHEDRPANPDHI